MIKYIALLSIVSVSAFADMGTDHFVVPDNAPYEVNCLQYVSLVSRQGGAVDPYTHNEDASKLRAPSMLSGYSYADTAKGILGNHLHMHFGVMGLPTDTPDTLQARPCSSNGGGTANRSTYWIPALGNIVTGQVYDTFGQNMLTYYTSNKVQVDAGLIEDFPVGFMYSSPGMMNTNPNGYFQAAKHIDYFCKHPRNPITTYGISKTALPVCAAGDELHVSIDFPECNDGRLFAADGSHMTWANTGNAGTQPNRCPSSHPHRLPKLTYLFTWVSDGDMANWAFSSDIIEPGNPYRGLSLHGGYITLWNHKIKQMWWENCLVARMDCGVGRIDEYLQLQIPSTIN